jgi:hypothetical protein
MKASPNPISREAPKAPTISDPIMWAIIKLIVSSSTIGKQKLLSCDE